MRWVLCLLAIGVLFPAGCGKTKGIEKKLPPVPVKIGQAAVKDVPLNVPTFGVVEAFSRVPIRCMVSGTLRKIGVQPGAFVKQGDILFEIDRRPFEAALLEAQAQLMKDKVQFEDCDRQAGMLERLLATNAVDANSAKSARAKADAQRASVLADEAAVKTAELNLEYCVVKSPISGRIGDFLVYEGTVIQASNTEVMNVVQMQPVYVTFSAPQSLLPQIRKYSGRGELTVYAKVRGADGPRAEGKLTFIDNAVNSMTGTVKLKSEFANRQLEFWPGQYVDVTLTLTVEKNCVVVPAQAVGVGHNGNYVFVVDDRNVAAFRPVRTGRTEDEETVVVSGLKEKERVVTNGLVRLYPGAEVTDVARTERESGK